MTPVTFRVAEGEEWCLWEEGREKELEGVLSHHMDGNVEVSSRGHHQTYEIFLLIIIYQ